MSRPLRIAGYILTGIVVGLIVAGTAIWLITRTDWGMERARRFAVSWLAEQVNGTLHIGRISGPGILGGMVIHDFGITDPRGRPFLATDSVELSYNWRSIVSGRIDLSRVVLYRPQAVLEILPGDTMWNYEVVFADSTRATGERQRRLIRFADTRIVDGRAIVRLGLDPNKPILPTDTARAIVERVPGGLARTMRFEQMNAHLPRVVWESPLENGRMFEIGSAQGRGYVWREPFIIQDVRGTLTLLDTIVSFDMEEVSLPNSRASIVGQVIRTEGQNKLDVRVDGERLQLADLQFLHPALPEQGSGRVRLSIKSQPDGILWLAENAQLNTEGTRLAGSVGVVMGDTMYFTRVNLTASPLDVQLLERLLPGGLPVSGLLVGTVEVRGPISALETRGDMRLEERGTGTSSQLAWRGVVDAKNRHARSMHADVERFDLGLLAAFNPRMQLSGTVSGSVDGSGSAEDMQFTGLLEHVSATGGRVVFDGGGTVSGTGRSRQLDIGVTTSSVTLQDLAKQIPALQGLHGELTGPFHVRGTPEDLTFAAQLVTPGGPLDITGGLRGDEHSRQIIAHASASAFRLDALRAGLPPTVVSGRLYVDLTGNDLASAAGTVRLELDSTRLYDLPNARLALHGTLGNGILAVDSARWRSSFGSATATGSVALLEGRAGALAVQFGSESLAPLEPWLFGATADTEPRVAGRVTGTAHVQGWIGALDVTANARAADMVYGGVAAKGVATDMRLQRRTGSPFEFTLGVTTDSLQLWSHPLQTARVDVQGRTDSLAYTIRAANGDDERIAARGALRMADSTLHIDALRVGGAAPWLLTAPATIALAGGTASTDRIELTREAGGRALARGTLAWTSLDDARALPLDFTLDLDGVPFTEVLSGVRSRETGAGIISGRLGVHGTALDPILEGTVDVRGLQYGDVRLDRAYAELNYAGTGLDVHAEAQYEGRNILSGGGRIPTDLRFANVPRRALAEPLRFTLTAANLPPALPLALLEGFSETAGAINGTINFAGTTQDPSMSGELRITNGAALWDVSGVLYHGANGTATLLGDRVVQLQLAARADAARNGAQPGVGNVQGTLDFTNLRDPRFELQLDATRVLAARRRDVEATVSGRVQLGGRYTRPELTGYVTVDEGTLYIEEMYRQYLIGAVQIDDLESRDPGLLNLVDTTLVAVRPLLSSSANPFLRGLWVRNLQLSVGADSWLRSREMDVEVRGDLLVAFDMKQEDLRLTGSLDVARGTYTLTYPPLQSRRFQVRDGSIEFLGTPGVDPNLSITAAYRARDSYGEPLDILAVVSGTLQSPRVRLSSDAQQPISESDLASYLFFGRPTWQVSSVTSATDSRDAAADLGMSVLAPSVLGYASSGLQTLVQSAGLLDYVALTAADGAQSTESRSFGIANFLTGTKLEVGRYFGSDLYVGYSQMLSTASLEPVMRLEWQFLPEYSLELFAEDRLARTPGFGLRPETGLRRVYGFLLFREWGF